MTLNELRRLVLAKEPITVLTAYDFPTALLSESAGVEMVLVGDSLSQVALGHESTTSITLDEMIHHARAVIRGAKTPFVFADLPMGSFEFSVSRGCENVIRMVKEAQVDGVKIEGGLEIVPLIKRLASIGIPVMPHIGLLPQRATSTSGYLVQGRDATSASRLFELAMTMQDAGATMILLEAIPHLLASHITESLDVPTIGIGAGPGTSGQVLVITDVLGSHTIPDDHPDPAGSRSQQPRFVRPFGDVGAESRRAVGAYIHEVKERTFPLIGKETYGMGKEAWHEFLSRPQAAHARPASSERKSGGEDLSDKEDDD